MAENCLNTPWDLKPFSDNAGQYYDLETYIVCVIPQIWRFAQIIFVTIAIITVMYLIYRTVTNRENTTVLEEVKKQWPYVIILAIVAIGGAGSFLNIALDFFGFGNVQTWLDSINDFVSWF